MSLLSLVFSTELLYRWHYFLFREAM